MTEPLELLLPADKPPIPRSETPVLRLMEGKAEYMTEGELLSVLLPPRDAQSALDTGRRRLAEYGSLQALAAAPPLDLARRCGLRHREACSLQAAMALGRRLLATPDLLGSMIYWGQVYWGQTWRFTHRCLYCPEGRIGVALQ